MKATITVAASFIGGYLTACAKVVKDSDRDSEVYLYNKLEPDISPKIVTLAGIEAGS
jgi:hypothetical protein